MGAIVGRGSQLVLEGAIERMISIHVKHKFQYSTSKLCNYV